MKYLRTKKSVKTAYILVMIATLVISIICMLNFNATSKTLAFAEENEIDNNVPVSYAWSQGMGIPIDVLDNEINYTLDTAIDNWFYFNCNTSGTYGFKFYYQSENVSEYLKLGMEVSNSGSITEVTNKKTLPYISYDSRKAIVYNFNLVAGNTYNFNFYLDNPDNYGIYYLDATIILSQWNSLDKAKLNNDVIIENNDEKDIYHLVSGQEYRVD